VDYATRYPEAVALPGISTEEVAEAQCHVFSRVGVPRQVLSDQGFQFVSSVPFALDSSCAKYALPSADKRTCREIQWDSQIHDKETLC